MKVKLLLASFFLLLAVLACNLPSAEEAGWLSSAQRSSGTTTLPSRNPQTPLCGWSPARHSPAATAFPLPMATPVSTGVIAGTLIYPSKYIPAQRIVAFDVSNPSVYCWVQTEDGQVTFELPVPPGTYYVVAYLLDGSLAAGYSQAVLCGLKYECTDHSLLPVVVRPGERVDDVRPHDWYAPSGAFPPMP